MDGVARKTADDFFARFAQAVTLSVEPAAPVAVPATAPAGMPWWVWFGAIALAVLGFLVLR